MRVLVTRPEPAAARTSERLRRMGHDPVVMPLFEARVTARPGDLPPAASVDAVVATSGRAFGFLGEEGAPDGYRRLPVHAVGHATARSATGAGFHCVHDGGGTARDLAGVLTGGVHPMSSKLTDAPDGSASSAKPLRLLYLAGRPRKPDLEAELAAGGLSVMVLETYEMGEISYSTDFENTDLFVPVPDAILFYSANAAAQFVALSTSANIGESLNSTRFLCLSQDIRNVLPDNWQPRTVAAERPDEESLLASLTGLG